MSPILSALSFGSIGASLSFPQSLRIERDEETFAQLSDPERQVTWWAFFFDSLYLDLSSTHFEVLRRDIENHTRFVFESGFASDISDRAPSHQPRTMDRNWSPLVDLQSIELGGVAALVVVHRLFYEPRRETVMGHLLVPLRLGLLELRCLSIARLTGYREAVLVDEAAQGMNPARVDEPFARMAKMNFDDTAYDHRFPEHPLSLVRAALRWCRTLEIKVTQPADYKAEGEVALDALGRAFTPPPRFVFVGPSPRSDTVTCYEFHRLSFSGMDGIDRLLVIETKERLKVDAPDAFAKRALALSREIHVEADVQGVECRADSVAEISGLPYICVIVEGQGHAGTLRTAMCWFLDEGGLLSCLSIGTTTAQPSGVLIAELQAALSSWRRTRNRPSRPWWKPWA